ncbi:hypothetical protein BDV93DRAFT_523284 [Ceratobasidium sp. AG-I]|nr:hypothetical protein BDV93DRAFT_523284 [Ceratobasidium sp. AG-I]
MAEPGPSGSNGPASEYRPRVWPIPENLVYYDLSTRYSSEDSIIPSPTSTLQPHPRPPPIIKCTICLESIPESSKRVSTPRCTHDCVVCADCLERHIVFSVRERGVTDVVCPTSFCAEVMAYDEVYAAVKDQGALERYENLLVRRNLQKVQNFVWCKNAKCSSGQIHEGGASCPTVKCIECSEESCFVHGVPWHYGLTCNQYNSKVNSSQNETVRATQAYLSKNAKACPNPKCGRMIEKTSGCDHMTCAMPVGCGHEFCWCCLADYEPIYRSGNHRHKRRCRHYDSRVKNALRSAIVWILRL